MRSLRLIASALGAAALLALCAPGAALAGTYSWSQPGDFSPSAGANPQQKYGQPSWGYYQGSLLTGLSPLSYDASLPGWDDSSGDSVQVSGSNLVMQAGANGGSGSSVTVAWNDPFDSSQPISWSYSNTPGTVPCTSFSVTDKNGNSLASGSPVTGPIYVTASSLLVACSENVQMQLQTTTSTVTLTNPTNGAVFTNGEPQFAGTASTAFDASGTVSVTIYSGSSLVATLPAAVAPNGAYTAALASLLPNGTYTAQAEQDDPLGQQNLSAPVTFTLNNGGAPGLTLNSPGSKPLTTSTPTLTGTAGTQAGDSNQATLLVYSGTSASGSPVRQDTGTVGSGGQFAIQVAPGLADGTYTAVATQTGPGVVGFSRPVSFSIKAHPPSLTLTYPQRHASVPRSGLFFYGQAGNSPGDSGTVNVQLWRGTRARGKSLGKVNVRVRDAAWSLQWPRRLATGRYTIRAVQTDNAGHTTTTPGRSFTVVPGLPIIGPTISLTRSGRATLRVSCLPRGQGSCGGTVLVVTTQSLRTASGGPAGPLRVVFAYVNIAAGGTVSVGANVPANVARALRSARGVTVQVTVALRHSNGSTSSATAGRSLKISS